MILFKVVFVPNFDVFGKRSGESPDQDTVNERRRRYNKYDRGGRVDKFTYSYVPILAIIGYGAFFACACSEEEFVDSFTYMVLSKVDCSLVKFLDSVTRYNKFEDSKHSYTITSIFDEKALHTFMQKFIYMETYIITSSRDQLKLFIDSVRVNSNCVGLAIFVNVCLAHDTFLTVDKFKLSYSGYIAPDIQDIVKRKNMITSLVDGDVNHINAVVNVSAQCVNKAWRIHGKLEQSCALFKCKQDKHEPLKFSKLRKELGMIMTTKDLNECIMEHIEAGEEFEDDSLTEIMETNEINKMQFCVDNKLGNQYRDIMRDLKNDIRRFCSDISEKLSTFE